MDSQQLQQLASNTHLNHWSPHLGVTTDAEKIEYLAQRLEEAADAEDRANSLSKQLATAEEAGDMFQSEIQDLKDKLEKIRELAQ